MIPFSRGEKFADEVLPHRFVATQRIKLLRLVNHQEYAISARLLFENSGQNVSQGNPTVAEGFCQFPCLAESLNFVQVWFEHWNESGCQASERILVREHRRDFINQAALGRTAQARKQSGAYDRRLTAPRRPDDRNEISALSCGCDRINECFAPAEETSVFFAKEPQAAIWADFGARSLEAFMNIGSGRLSSYGFRQDLVLRWIGHFSSQINPCVQTEKIQRRFRVWQ